MHIIACVQVIAMNKNQRKTYSQKLHKIIHPETSSTYYKMMSLYGNYGYVQKYSFQPRLVKSSGEWHGHIYTTKHKIDS